MSEDIKQYVVSEETLDTIAQKILSQPNNEDVDSITIADFADKIPNVQKLEYPISCTLEDITSQSISVEPEDGYDAIASATVDVQVDTTNIARENIKSGVTILGITGSYAGDVNGSDTVTTLDDENWKKETKDEVTTYSRRYLPSDYTTEDGEEGIALEDFTLTIKPGDLDTNNILSTATILGVGGSVDIEQTANNETINTNSSYDEENSCYYTEVTPTNLGGLKYVKVSTGKTTKGLTSNDIYKGKFALGIEGAHVCKGVQLANDTTKTLENKNGSQTFTPNVTGTYWNELTVNVDKNNEVLSNKIVSGKSIYGVSGKYEIQNSSRLITASGTTTIPIKYKDGTNNTEQETGKTVSVTVPELSPKFTFYASGEGVNQIGNVMLSNASSGWVNTPTNYDEEIPNCQSGNICYDTTIAGVTGSLIPWNDSTVQFEVTSLSITGEHDKANFEVNLRNTGSNPNETVKSRTVTASNIDVPFPGIMLTTESFERDVDFSTNNKLYRILEVLGVTMDNNKYITVLAAEVDYTAKEMFGYTETTQTNRENWALSSNIKYRPLQSYLYKTAIPGSITDKYNVWLLELNTYYGGTISDNGDGISFKVKATQKRVIGWQ